MYTCSNDLRLTLNVGRAVSYVLSKPSWLLLEYDWTRCMYLRVLNLGVCVCPFVLVRYCSKVVGAEEGLLSVKRSSIMFYQY